MVDLKELQRLAYKNKVDHGFNVTDVPMEFCLMHNEMAEAYTAYSRGESGLAEELADVAIYLLGLSEICGVDLESAILAKMEKNRRRVYKPLANGILVKAEDEGK